ncbi:PaaI family thioesterase [Ponticaulis sp.]|uniref:PaaI family thioesterase n=1 Tax=Ponticaulis sp. TaxID=2020902 RepID=UPI000B7228DC|nr:PaaI family thioesterase [Ponticaulis sp.]MAI90524.1 thioesterase [Ponticaulis sp.]OUY00218.1 MAG: thioesterase [Hyphomonadaceae bacterium TMED5]|tara:strand:+ start:150904 stop:151329 length:426 start_codon:yes stop_codon:yes gene_type:complete
MGEDIYLRQEKLQAYLERTPFASFLGFRCEIMGDEMTAILPFNEKIIGNPTIRALHGGATGAFLELTAMAQLFLLSEEAKMAKPINLTIDYLRQARSENLYARAEVTKQGRRIANVHAEAWQAERSRPVATLNAHFLLSDD